MERDELLKKVRQGKPNDEWEQSIEDRANTLGYAVTVFLALIVAIVEYFLKDPHWEIVGIPMIGIGVGDIYGGIKTSNKKKKYIGIINLLVGLLFSIGAFAQR